MYFNERAMRRKKAVKFLSERKSIITIFFKNNRKYFKILIVNPRTTSELQNIRWMNNKNIVGEL